MTTFRVQDIRREKWCVLTRLQKDELIEVLHDDGRRKTYTITEEGKAALKTEYNRLEDMIRDGNILGRENKWVALCRNAMAKPESKS